MELDLRKDGLTLWEIRRRQREIAYGMGPYEMEKLAILHRMGDYTVAFGTSARNLVNVLHVPHVQLNEAILWTAGAKQETAKEVTAGIPFYAMEPVMWKLCKLRYNVAVHWGDHWSRIHMASTGDLVKHKEDGTWDQVIPMDADVYQYSYLYPSNWVNNSQWFKDEELLWKSHGVKQPGKE